MSEHEAKREQAEADDGHLAVPGSESHEVEDTLSPDERGADGESVPPPRDPK